MANCPYKCITMNTGEVAVKMLNWYMIGIDTDIKQRIKDEEIMYDYSNSYIYPDEYV